MTELQRGYVLRPATVADVATVNQLEHTIFGVEAWSEQQVLEELTRPDRHYLLAESNLSNHPPTGESSPDWRSQRTGLNPPDAPPSGESSPDRRCQRTGLNPPDALPTGELTSVNGIVGYGGVFLSDDADIMTLGVVEAWRGQGIARALLKHLLDKARAVGCRACLLEVRADNYQAIALYRSAGFQQVGLRRGYYYHSGADALTMRLALGSEDA
ncbi:MAG: ribosomal protein S18-alanine N-acetyltransferase [Bifidobacteriaceae bacterium]|jgi:ribosomal-protein-alanine N-acetyltransferase|nr:ribosomal protein S18-alanine N-acetyltransferase [Bifidobacteriaceae bacterium]